jgi:hypothetical protein
VAEVRSIAPTIIPLQKIFIIEDVSVISALLTSLYVLSYTISTVLTPSSVVIGAVYLILSARFISTAFNVILIP